MWNCIDRFDQVRIVILELPARAFTGQQMGPTTVHWAPRCPYGGRETELRAVQTRQINRAVLLLLRYQADHRPRSHQE